MPLPMLRGTARTLLRKRGYVYLLKDEFTTDAAAPLSSPRTCEPGPGTLTITDTNNKLSIVGGRLTFATGGAGVGDPRAVAAALARVTGRALLAVARHTTVGSLNAPQLGFGDHSETNNFYAVRANNSVDANTLRINVKNGVNTNTESTAVDTDYGLGIVLRSTGAFVLFKRADGAWTLQWVSSEGTDAALEQYGKVTGAATTTAGSFDNLRVLDLPSPYTDDYGIATQRLAGSVAAGTAFTHEANCLIEWTQTTLPAPGNTEVLFRMQDVNNCWTAAVTANGSFLLGEYVGGVFTQRASVGSGTVINGHRIVVIADGATIRGYSNNVLRWTYSSATNYQSATAGRMLTVGTGGVASELISWPRTLSGTALSTIDAA